jgi:hypothetical protein
MIRVAGALITLCLLCGAAAAKQAKLGAVALNLPPPTGYCELSEAQPSDASMITAIGGMLDKGGNRLLAISADCRQLDDWRAGRRPLLANYAQYQTLKAWENTSLPAAPAEVIKATCAQLRGQGESLTANMTPEVQKRFDEVMKTVKINEMKFLGVLGEDSKTCYAALLQRIRAQTGTDIAQTSVFASIIVKGKLVYYYLFAPYVNGQSVTDLLNQLRRNVAALEAANRN